MNARQNTSIKMADKNQFTDLRAVLSKYIYHWPLFILGLLLAAAGAYAYLHVVNPVYEINATILVKDEKKSPQEKAALPELEQSSSPKIAESEIEILRSKKLISQVVSDLQLWATYKTKNGLKSQDLYETSPVRFVLVKPAGYLQAKLNVYIKDKNTFEIENLSGQKQSVSFNTPQKNAFGTWLLKPTEFTDQFIGSTITIDVNDPDRVSNDYIKALDAHLLDKTAPTIGLFVEDEVPKRGQDFLNGLIKTYNEASEAEEKKKVKSTIDFIDSRLASLSGQLKHQEGQVEGYRSSQGLADLNSQTKSYLEGAQTNEQKLNDVNVQLNIIDGIDKYVNSNSTTNVPATIGITDPVLPKLVERLSELQLKKSELLANTPENNPIFDPINKQIAVTKSSIEENIRGIRSSLVSSQKQLQAFNNKMQSSINSVPVQERQFGDMKRQQSINENMYVYLLQKREELALSYASQVTDARIVDQASIGDIKWPRTPLVAAIALLLGIGIPFMMIFFRHSLGHKITERRDIERETNIPILGEVSHEDLGKDVIVVNQKNNLVGEQFRALRTNLHYFHNSRKERAALQLDLHKGVVIPGSSHDHTDERGRVTLLTSSVSGEGKSWVSTNLASSIALSGRKTVLLEMDLRKPKISGIFDLSADHAGINEYLSYNARLDDIIQPSNKVKNLDIIGCGHIPDEPSELLEKDRLNDLINELRERYDDIVIDTPPLHLVTDAMIIARHTDVSLYIIRQGYTGKDELEFMKEVADTEKLPYMNIVFNGIKRGKYGYGYNYDNSYYSKSNAKTFKGSFKKFLSRF